MLLHFLRPPMAPHHEKFPKFDVIFDVEFDYFGLELFTVWRQSSEFTKLSHNQYRSDW
jgi:hypothetical protein